MENFTFLNSVIEERSVSLRRLWLTLLSESLRRAARNVYHEATDAQTDGILSSLIATGQHPG